MPPPGTEPAVVPVELRTRDDSGMIATGDREPRLRWRLEATRDSVVQLGYELQVARDAEFADAATCTSGFVRSDLPFDARWPAPPLRSREIRWCRVRVWTERGVSAWSTPLRVEAGLLDSSDWLARPVTPLGNVSRAAPAPVPLLRREFTLPAPVVRARLFVTALGVFDAWLNGRPVSLDVLEPGWSSYPSRHLFAAYDVTGLLHEGPNALAAAVGDGWWRGELGWSGKRAHYGDTTALLAQLEVELAGGERVTIATDRHWRGSTGGLRSADLYAGAEIDLRSEPTGWRLAGFDDSRWEPVATLALPGHLRLRMSNAVRVVRTIEVTPRLTSRGSLMVDCGENLTGWLRIHAKGPSGAHIVVRHAEVLDDAGELHTAALRNARATDRHVLDGAGTFALEPRFTFHGFRFAEIRTIDAVQIDRVEAIVISSDIRPDGDFICSDTAVNRLVDNVRRSQRGNFLSLPTDCPQRDERMGWTGDIQAFAPTACTLSDVRAFLAGWLRDLAVEQRADGCVPVTVPNIIHGEPFEFGSAGWGDAATLVPWALHEAYGDTQLLRDQFASMAAWVDWCAARRNAQGVREGGFQFGDWLDPGAPPGEPQKAATDSDYIATAFLSRSAAIVAKAADILGLGEQAEAYCRLSAKAADAAWRRWREHALTTQTGCAIAIMFDLATGADRAIAGRRLAELVERSGGRIATGFLGTPLIAPALTETGHVNAAYRLLLNREAPGWLYQVDRGATTMWERWDAIRPDGSIHGGEMSMGEAASMTSFNHYAYGAVADWLFRSVAGIAPAAPGYRTIRFAPRPGGGLTHAAARLGTPFGDARIAWRLEATNRMAVEAQIPPGATGEFLPPDGWRVADAPSAPLGSGRHGWALERR